MVTLVQHLKKDVQTWQYITVRSCVTWKRVTHVVWARCLHRCLRRPREGVHIRQKNSTQWYITYIDHPATGCGSQMQPTSIIYNFLTRGSGTSPEAPKFAPLKVSCRSNGGPRFLTDQLGKIVRAMQPGRPAEPISKKAQK